MCVCVFFVIICVLLSILSPRSVGHAMVSDGVVGQASNIIGFPFACLETATFLAYCRIFLVFVFGLSV